MTRSVPVEIGNLDAWVELPSEPRRSAGLKMTCESCKTLIEEPTFAGGFKTGMKNLVLHVACVPPGTPNPRRDS